MKILLTGGSGFIGKNLLEKLSKQYKILAPTHKELDLRSWQAIEAYIIANNIDVIVHTAVGKEEKVLPDTLRMFFSILKNADKVKKIIHFGSGAEYSKTRDLIRVKESDFGKYIPQDDYGFAKYICSKVAERYKNVITLRLFGIYGKYENYLIKFISNSIAKNLVGLPLTIKQDVIFDYLYIDDLVSIVRYVIEHDMKNNYYNITPIKSISLSKIAAIINSMSDNVSSIFIANRGLNFQYTGDNSSLLNELKKFKFRSYNSGIQNLYDYYKKTEDLLDIKKMKKDVFFRVKNIKR